MSGATQSFDAIVVGAGIVGCATAYELARSGLDVALVDKGDIGGAVSGASLACIGTHMLAHDELPLLIEARARWAMLPEELDADFEYNVGGQIRFVRREDDIAVAQSWIDRERAYGLSPQLLDPPAVREIVPALKGPIVAATWSPKDATVNPFLACRAFVEAAARHGCRTFPNTAVTAVLRSAMGVTGVEMGRERLSAPYVINAAGPWAARVAAMAGVSVPVKPRKAQCLATVAIAPTIPCVVGACESAGGVEAGYTQIQQSARGQVLFNTVLAGGVGHEGRQDDDLSVDRQFVADSVDTLLWLFPDLSDIALLRSWCAYEGVTPDDKFLIGPVPEVGGFLMAAGDGGTGFNRAPVIGQMIAHHVRGTPFPLSMQPYLPDRFATRLRAA